MLLGPTNLHWLPLPHIGPAHLSFWLEQHVHKEEYGTLVEWYWQAKTKVFGEKPIQFPICTSPISHGLIWDWTQASVVTAWQLTACVIAQPMYIAIKLSLHIKIQFIPHKILSCASIIKNNQCMLVLTEARNIVCEVQTKSTYKKDEGNNVITTLLSFALLSYKFLSTMLLL
jgi:hypothetical protein